MVFEEMFYCCGGPITRAGRKDSNIMESLTILTEIQQHKQQPNNHFILHLPDYAIIGSTPAPPCT